MLRLGVIGYGGRIQGVLQLIHKFNMDTKVVAITDVRNDEIKATMRSRGEDPDGIVFFSDADEMLDSVELDGVLIGTRCSLHTPMALKVLRRNLPLYLEKPVATSLDVLLKLKSAWEESESEVVVSFPLRATPLVQLAKEIIDSGKIGTVEHVQAWNNVPYGAVYYQWWYRDENETGGLFLQKATHDFDYINYLLGLQPRWICAMASKQIFKGDRPAGLRCNDCSDWEECMESPFNLYYKRCETDDVRENPYMCQFAKDTGNEDSSSALIEYETGMHAAYSQNFFARRGAGARGARLFGYSGTLEFDWYTDEVKVFMHHTPRTETYKVDSSAMSHGGGDTVLAYNFVQVMLGKEKSMSSLDAGLLSALMCIKARESAETKVFQEIVFPEA